MQRFAAVWAASPRKLMGALLMLLVAAASASLEAPRLAQRPLAQATVELVDIPDATSGAVQRLASNVSSSVSPNVSSSHLGFDTNVYPGDKAMDAWKRAGEFEWVGYYLSAPCHKDDSWEGKRAHLVDNGWGLAVIYVGQQTWGTSYSPTTVRRVTSGAVSRRNWTKCVQNLLSLGRPTPGPDNRAHHPVRRNYVDSPCSWHCARRRERVVGCMRQE